MSSGKALNTLELALFITYKIHIIFHHCEELWVVDFLFGEVIENESSLLDWNLSFVSKTDLVNVWLYSSV